MIKMKNKAIQLIIVSLFLPLLLGFANKPHRMSLWERHCEACHDGQTVLNGNVVIGKNQMKAKYKTSEDLEKAVACQSPPCMNILKHDKTLIRKVSKEIGLIGVEKK
jgi:hypothetical protein